MKEEALKFAEKFNTRKNWDEDDVIHWCWDAETMIRRLVEELDKQGEPDYFILTQDHTWLSCNEDFYNKANPTHRMKCYTTPQTKPLSDDDVEEFEWALKKYFNYKPDTPAPNLNRIIRAIEAKVRGEK